MFKILKHTTSSQLKGDLTPKPYSRIFIFKDMLIVIYDKHITFNNIKINFVVKTAIKKNNTLIISDDKNTYIFDFNLFVITNKLDCINHDEKSINKENLENNNLCIDDEIIKYKNVSCQNVVKFKDLDFSDTEDIFYYSCVVDDMYIFIVNDKTSTISLFNDKLEEEVNEFIYVPCDEDGNTMYLRGMDSTNDTIVTINKNGDISTYKLKDVEEHPLLFKKYVGENNENIFKELMEHKNDNQNVNKLEEISASSNIEKSFVNDDTNKIEEDSEFNTKKDLSAELLNNLGFDFSKLNTISSDKKNETVIIKLEDKEVSKDNTENTVIQNDHLNMSNTFNNMTTSLLTDTIDPTNELHKFKKEDDKSSVNFTKEKSVKDILSDSIDTIIRDIKNIQVNKSDDIDYKFTEYNFDDSLRNLYNKIMKLENIDSLQNDMENNLTFMINKLQLRNSIDEDYLKKSIKYFDTKINQRNKQRIPFVYNRGIIDLNTEHVKDIISSDDSLIKLELDIQSMCIIKDETNKNEDLTDIKENKDIFKNNKDSNNNKKDNFNNNNKVINNQIIGKDINNKDYIAQITSKDINNDKGNDNNDSYKGNDNNNYKDNNNKYNINKDNNNKGNYNKDLDNNNTVITHITNSNLDNNINIQNSNIFNDSGIERPSINISTNSSDIFNKMINSGSSIPTVKKEVKKEESKTPNAFSRFANNNNLYK